MDYLLNLRERMANAKELLTDEALTSFFFVTLPEALPIAVITRFINWFHEFGIPVGGVIVNMLIDKASVQDGLARFREEPRGDAGRAHGDDLEGV